MRGPKFFAVAALFALLAHTVPSAAQVSTVDLVPQLRTTPSSMPEYVYVGGYNVVTDQGGGWFYTQGGSSGAGCPLAVSSASATWWSGASTPSPVITVPLSSSLPSAGMAIAVSPTPPTGIPPYDMVVSTSTGVSNATITLAYAPTVGNSGAVPLYFAADNGGNTIYGGGTYACFKRTSSDYTPQEWGAYEDYPALHDDDTLALENWMNAPQPHYALPGGSLITQTLWCNDGAIIQGSPTAGVTNTSQVLPTFNIYANKATYGFTGPAMLVMNAGSRCAIHSLGLIGDDSGYFDTVDANGTADLIDQHSYLSGGCHNLAQGTGNADLEIFDSSLVNSMGDNVVVTSANSKIVRNVIAGAGAAALAHGCANTTASLGNNITFSSSDIVIADNTIEQAQGWGIDIESGRLLRITGNHFDSNGLSLTSSSNATGGVKIATSGSITLCGNTFNASGSGAEGVSGLTTSHIYFFGQDDSISLCGNSYLPAVASGSPPNQTPSVFVAPDYDYDANAGAILTNVSIADNPAPQVGGSSVFSLNAIAALTSSNVGQIPQNYFAGLTLSNATLTSNVINIAPGSAADSTGSAMITVPSTGCTVTIGGGSYGLNRLDVNSFAANTTYFYFVVSGARGANPSCMASANPTPSFLNATYTIPLIGYTDTGSKLVYNVGGPDALGMSATQVGANTLASVAVNDYVTCSCLSGPAQITSLTPFKYQPSPGSFTISGSCISGSGIGSAGLQINMLVSGPSIPANDYVTLVNTGACGASSVTLNAAATGTTGTVTFAGNYTMTLNAAATGPNYPGGGGVAFTVHHGLYRLAGELYTTGGGSPTVVNFTQDNDTFYLSSPVQDINTTATLPICSVGTAVTTCALSIPCGRTSVASSTCAASGAPELEAFGRIVGGDVGNGILLASGDITPTAPTNFITGQPGYTTTIAGTTTSYPFRLYATINGTSGAYVNVIGSSGTGTLDAYEITDGWIFHRSQ
jgi:hypothetical protein